MFCPHLKESKRPFPPFSCLPNLATLFVLLSFHTVHGISGIGRTAPDASGLLDNSHLQWYGGEARVRRETHRIYCTKDLSAMAVTKRKSEVSVTRSPIHASSSSFTLKTCQVRAKKGLSAPQCVEAYSLDWAEGSRWRLHKSKWPRCRAIAKFFAKRESQTDTYSNQE